MELTVLDLEAFQYVLLGVACAWAFIQGLRTLS